MAAKKVVIGVVLGCGCLTLILVGIVAVVALPSLLHARIPANEAQAIGDLRAVISAEMAYQSASGGRFGTLECLTKPSSCLKGYSGPAFLSQAMALERSGYRRAFTLSADQESFTLVAAPETPGSSGIRTFCGDGTGVICMTSGSRPNTSGGRCELDSTCTPL